MILRAIPPTLLAAAISTHASGSACFFLDEIGISGRPALLSGTSLTKTSKGWRLAGSHIQLRWGGDFEGSPVDTLAGPLELRETTDSDMPGLLRALSLAGNPEVPHTIGSGDQFTDPPDGCEKGNFSITGSHPLRTDRRFPLPIGIGPLVVERGELRANSPRSLNGSKLVRAVMDRSGSVIAGKSPSPWKRLLDGSLEIVAGRGIDFLGRIPDIASATTLSVRLLPRFGDSLRCGFSDAQQWNWADSANTPVRFPRAITMRRVGETWLSHKPVRVRWGIANLHGNLKIRNWTENDDGGTPRILVSLVDPEFSTPWSAGRRIPGEVFIPDQGWRDRGISLPGDSIRGDLPHAMGRFVVKDSLILTRRLGTSRCEEHPFGFLDKHVLLERDGIRFSTWLRTTKSGRMSYHPWPTGFDPSQILTAPRFRTWIPSPPLADTATWRMLPGIGKFRATGETGFPSRDSVDIHVILAVDSIWRPHFDPDTFPMVHRSAWSGKIDFGTAPRLFDGSQFLQRRIGSGKTWIAEIDTLETIAGEGSSTFQARGRRLVRIKNHKSDPSGVTTTVCKLEPSMECRPSP